MSSKPRRVEVRLALGQISLEETQARTLTTLPADAATLARWTHRPEFAFAEQVVGEFAFEQTARAMVERWLPTMGGLDRYDRAGRSIT